MTETAQERDQRLAYNWSRLSELMLRNVIGSFADQSVHASYMMLLNMIRHDRIITLRDRAEVQLGLYRAPGSKDYHHRREGGLIEHMLEMWQLWEAGFKPMLSAFGSNHPAIRDHNVWRAIFHHDLNKVWKYALLTEAEWKVDYAMDLQSDLLGSSGKILHMLQLHGIRLPPLLINAILASEGGYSADPPRTETSFAKLVYLLDEMSANVVDRVRNKRFWDAKHEDPNDQEERANR
jgi:hypothetical protein